MENEKETGLTLGRNLKIGMFHLGSGMADVLATGVWNRIMVADLGYGATFVGLLTGLRYFLAPLGIWAGRYSDTHVVVGYRRLFWIWLGRAMMALSTISLGFATAELLSLGQDQTAAAAPALIWLIVVLSFLLFSLGNAISGSTFLALLHDRAAPDQRGRAVGLVWTFLLIGFTVGGILFSVMLPSTERVGELALSSQSIMLLFLVTGVLLALIWFFSLLGEERRHSTAHHKSKQESVNVLRDLSVVWRSRPMRFFFLFLVLSMMFAFLQDTVLEPFAGQVFDMDVRTTSRFAAYWGSMAILGSFGFLYLSRRYQKLSSGNIALGGVWVLLAAYVVFAFAAIGETRSLMTPGLILLGLGLGIWNIGTWGLMMDLSPDGRAGTFLGFWTLCATFARGLGVAGGGLLRDLALQASGEFTFTYAAVFAVGALGLLVALLALGRANLRSSESRRSEIDIMLAAASD